MLLCRVNIHIMKERPREIAKTETKQTKTT